MSKMYPNEVIALCSTDYPVLAVQVMRDVLSDGLKKRWGDAWERNLQNWIRSVVDGKEGHVSGMAKNTVTVYYKRHENDIRPGNMDVTACWAVICGLGCPAQGSKAWELLDSLRKLRNIAAHNNNFENYEQVLQSCGDLWEKSCKVFREALEILPLKEATQTRLKTYLNGTLIHNSW